MSDDFYPEDDYGVDDDYDVGGVVTTSRGARTTTDRTLTMGRKRARFDS